MAYPETYERQYDYVGYQNANPTRPLPATRVHIDLNDVSRATTEIIDFISGITNSDGTLGDATVGVDQLTPDALVTLAGGADAVEGLFDFEQDATGAVTRTLAEKAAETFSVLDFIPAIVDLDAIANHTSTADLTTYLNAAIAATKARFGILLWPRGSYTATRLDASGLRNVGFQGEGGLDLTYAGTSGTVIRLTGTGTSSLIDVTEHRGLWCRDIQFVYTSDAFSGTVVDCSTTFQTGCGSGFERCQIYQKTGTGHTAARGFYLKNNVDMTLRNCYVSHVGKGIVGVLSTDVGAETNMIRIEKCTTIACVTAGIHNPVRGWTIDQHNYEPTDTNAPGAITTDGAFDIINLTEIDCVVADSTANGVAYKFDNNTFNYRRIGGAILALSGTCTGIQFNGTFHGQPQILGVYVSGLTTGIDYNSGAASVAGANVQNTQFLSTTTPVAHMSNCDASSIFLANTPDTANRALTASYGGTGQQAGYTAGDLLYANGATTLAKLGVGAAHTFLKGGTLPAYAAIASDDLAPVTFLNVPPQTVNFNSANTDTAFNIPALPSGYAHWQLQGATISGASASLTTATFGIFTAAATGGTALVTNPTACTVSTASEDTANNMQQPAIINNSNQSHNQSQVFFRVITPQGSAATAKVALHFKAIP